ncbi:hypothetical protein GF378_02220, partial [Candidatus Pacearchaeota archaeon]|nr:hypothetical protein [Candidatus Pacearchaeota archaeon]
MNKKRVIPIALVVLISLSVFVSAYMTESDYGPYDVEIKLQEGWNIVAGTILEDGISANSEIQLNDIEVMWYYSPLQKKYIRTYPDADWEGINQDDEDFALTNAMWIYSNKAGTIKYDTFEDYPPLNLRQLYSGWNFVTI